MTLWRLILGFIPLFSFLFLNSCQSAESLQEKAKELADTKRFAEAEIEYRKALQKDNNAAIAHLGLAEALRGQDKGSEALASYLRAYEVGRETPAVRNRVAEVILDLYLLNPRKPKVLYDQLSKLSKDFQRLEPKSFMAFFIDGTLAMSDQKFGEAVSLFQLARSQRQDNLLLNLSLVEGLFLDNKPKEAEELGLKLLDANPKSTAVYDRLYTIYLQSKRTDAATKLLEDQIRRNPSSSVAILRMAEHYSNQLRDRDKAEELLWSLARNAQQYPEGALDVARTLLQASNPKFAARILEERLPHAGSRVVEMRKLLSEAYFQIGRPQEAGQQIALAAKAAPNDMSILYAESVLTLLKGTRDAGEKALGILEKLKAEGYAEPRLEVQRGRALFLVNRREEAVRTLQEYLKRRPRDMEPRLILANYYMQRNLPGDALRLMEEVENFFPDNWEAWQMRLVILRQLNRLDEARNLLQQLKPRFGEDKRLVREEGMQFMAQKRYDAAVGVFQGLYSGGDRSYGLIGSLVNAYLGANRAPQALTLLNQELQQAPDNELLIAMRADVYAAQGKLPAAISEYERLAERPSANHVIRRMLARLYGRNNQLPKSIPVYQRLATEQAATPNDYAAWFSALLEVKDTGGIERACSMMESQYKDDWGMANNCAYALAEGGGSLDRAEQLVRAHIGLSKNSPSLRDTLGLILLRKSRTAEALSLLEGVAAEDPRNAEFQYHRALALKAVGRLEEAKASILTAQQLPRSPQLDKNLQQAKSDWAR